MTEKYDKQSVMNDILALQRLGLIEVVAINDEGEEQWSATEFGRSLTMEQAAKIIEKSLTQK